MSDMTKNERIDQLFERWCEEWPAYRGHLIRDGIIDEETYDQQSTKILFIAKEANDPGQTEWDFRTWWNEQSRVSHAFCRRLAEWAYGILHGFPPLASIDEPGLASALRSVAFMNLKKMGGGGSANMEAIENTVKLERALLIEQIEIIAPDIIVGSAGYSRILHHLFSGADFVDSGYDVHIAKWRGSRIVDYYHPSYRVPRAMAYSLLACVIQSDAFRDF